MSNHDLGTRIRMEADIASRAGQDGRLRVIASLVDARIAELEALLREAIPASPMAWRMRAYAVLGTRENENYRDDA